MRVVFTRIVFTNGCFDLFHDGHRKLLHEAGLQGDWLVVAVNDDASVRALKGADRPAQRLVTRLDAVYRHPAVHAAIPFGGDVEALVRAIQPWCIVKGDDHDPATLAGGKWVLDHGGRVVIVQRNGISTTELLKQSRRLKA